MEDCYRNQQILAASPADLTLLLYNGAIRFINESTKAIDLGDWRESHNANLRAQDIVSQFMITLDMKYEISKTWLSLYEYCLYCLFQGNIKKDKEELLKAKLLLTDLREAWILAMGKGHCKQAVRDKTVTEAEKAWIDYRSLLKKMVMCLKNQDMEVFYKYVHQRKQLQKVINQITSDDFISSGDGKRILFEIKSDSHFIDSMLQVESNKHKQKTFTGKYYDRQDSSISNRCWQR
ncbi:MAG: flagellar export chaperone FliS [Pelosinus sp.]|nr:flagellar export chaperone FliS [Pelosinus sp.]